MSLTFLWQDTETSASQPSLRLRRRHVTQFHQSDSPGGDLAKEVRTCGKVLREGGCGRAVYGQTLGVEMSSRSSSGILLIQLTLTV